MHSISEAMKNLFDEFENMSDDEWGELDKLSKLFDDKQHALDIIGIVDRAGIPKLYRDAMVCNLDDNVREIVDDLGLGVLMQGQCGRGKTYAACAILMQKAMNGDIKSGMFTTFAKLLEDIKAGFGKDFVNPMERALDVDLLIIDDVGKERLTEWSQPILFTIVDSRMCDGKPTIMTTNYSGVDLAKKFMVNDDPTTAKAIISRMSMYKRIVFEGEDRRING